GAGQRRGEPEDKFGVAEALAEGSEATRTTSFLGVKPLMLPPRASMRAHGSPAAPVSPAVEGTLVEHARRDEDPPGPYDLPPSHFRRLERRHARIGPQVLGG